VNSLPYVFVMLIVNRTSETVDCF